MPASRVSEAACARVQTDRAKLIVQVARNLLALASCNEHALEASWRLVFGPCLKTEAEWLSFRQIARQLGRARWG